VLRSNSSSEPRAVTIELALLRRLARAVLESLERERQRLDGLNVYPVPDGDTGANLVLTVQALVDELDAAEDERVSPERLARTLLMGARGASGVILSQIVRGTLEAGAPADSPLNAPALAAMLGRARAAAYGAVHKPVEGTMLTLMRELAEECRARRHRKLPLDRLLMTLIERGEEALARTPDRLAVLRENDVVDAGAAGLLVCLRAIAVELSAEQREELAPVLRLVPALPGD
jgi:dihydroxyacetone kinase-like predicted kinase